MQNIDVYTQSEINKRYQDLASSVVSVAIEDFIVLFKHYLLTGGKAMHLKKNNNTLFLKEVVNFMLSPTFELYVKYNIDPLNLLKMTSEKVYKDMIEESDFNKRKIDKRYYFWKERLKNWGVGGE